MVTESVTETEAKVEIAGMRNYELVLIIRPELPDEKLDATIENVSKFIAGKGGVIAGVDRWGKRKLAYPVKHLLEGFYVLTKFAMKPAVGKELEANLRISEDVVRYLLIELD